MSRGVNKKGIDQTAGGQEKSKIKGLTVWDPGVANPKQEEFYMAKELYVGFGGAKAGGKTHAVRIKAFGTALMNPGIKIIIFRKTYPALEENHILPLKRMAVKTGAATYNGTTKMLTFVNGSTIRFGHWSGADSEDEYNGQEYDRVFLDEATQFSERAFNLLAGMLRGASPYPKQMYITCNPGGVGHNWVKRLFIDRQYETGHANPEEDEHPEDYRFIWAKVEDNVQMLKHSPKYLEQLSKLPEDVRHAYRYGDWDSLGGGYFKEFKKPTHVRKAFKIPDHWKKYRAFDYGLDMFACVWFAVDTDGRAWAYREVEKKGLIIQDAAALCLRNSPAYEKIEVTYAPWDMWSRTKESGKTMADQFLMNGLLIVQSPRDRVQGHMAMKSMMAPLPLKDTFVRSLFPEGQVPATMPGLMFFSDLGKVIKDIEEIQADDNNPNDCAKDPHEITHTVDAVRGFCVSRILPTEAPETKPRRTFEDLLEEKEENYESFMCGGEPGPDYLGAA